MGIRILYLHISIGSKTILKKAKQIRLEHNNQRFYTLIGNNAEKIHKCQLYKSTKTFLKTRFRLFPFFTKRNKIFNIITNFSKHTKKTTTPLANGRRSADKNTVKKATLAETTKKASGFDPKPSLIYYYTKKIICFFHISERQLQQSPSC